MECKSVKSDACLSSFDRERDEDHLPREWRSRDLQAANILFDTDTTTNAENLRDESNLVRGFDFDAKFSWRPARAKNEAAGSLMKA